MMRSGRQRDASTKLEFSLSNCFLPSSCIWAGTSRLLFWCAKAGGPTLAPNPFPECPLEQPEDLEDAEAASKRVYFHLLKLYVALDVHPRIWVFLSQNEEKAKWLGNSSRFYSSFTISGNFLSGLYGRTWLVITVSYSLRVCIDQHSDLVHSLCTFRAGSWQASFPPRMWIWEWTERIQHPGDQGIEILTYSCSVKIKARKASAWI